MSANKFDVIVIGSGPSAWAALAAIPSNYSVLNVDIGKTENTDTKKFLKTTLDVIKKSPIDEDEIRSIIQTVVDPDDSALGSKKNFYGDNYMYDVNDLLDRDPRGIRKSTALGGYASIWGATMLPLPANFLNKIHSRSKQKLIRGYAFLLSKIEVSSFSAKGSRYEFPNKLNLFSTGTLLQHICLRRSKKHSSLLLKIIDATFEPIGVAVQGLTELTSPSDDTQCSKCGLCQLGCPKNLIWNPRYSAPARSLTNYKYINANVKKIISIEGKLFIHCFDHKVVYEARTIILAAGAIGTAEILVNSQLSENFSNLRIRDNQTVFRHGLSVRKVGNLHPRMNLAELTLLIGSNGKNPISAQLYSISQYTRIRILALYPFLKKIPKLLQNMFLFRLTTLLVYFDDEQSGFISVSKQGDIVVMEENAKYPKSKTRFTNYIRISFPLLSKLIFLFPFFQQKMLVGGGNHIGSTEYQNVAGKFDKICNENGTLKGEEHILISDSSALPWLYPGPITMTTMANGYSNVSDYFSTKL